MRFGLTSEISSCNFRCTPHWPYICLLKHFGNYFAHFWEQPAASQKWPWVGRSSREQPREARESRSAKEQSEETVLNSLQLGLAFG